MKWIVVAIIACVLPYTWVTLKYRKEEPAFQPYHDMKAKAQALRLDDSGYRRLSLAVSRPVEPGQVAPPAPHAAGEVTAGGLPELLREVLLDQPLLPMTINRVVAAAESDTAAEYAVQFTCTQLGDHEQLAHVTAYLRGQELTLVPGLDALAGDLTSRTRDTTAQIALPAQWLTAGTYEVTLVGAERSLRWTLRVR